MHRTVVLAAVDFDDATPAVVEMAQRVAGADGRVILVHVAAPDPDFVGFAAGPDTVRDARAEELRDEHRHLQRMADSLRAHDVDATALLVQGPTVETLLAQADDLDADIVVVGSHGRSGIAKFMLGSVGEAMVRESHRPVLVVRPRHVSDADD